MFTKYNVNNIEITYRKWMHIKTFKIVKHLQEATLSI